MLKAETHVGYMNKTLKKGVFNFKILKCFISVSEIKNFNILKLNACFLSKVAKIVSFYRRSGHN
jgi:hypothetical protein